MCSQTSDCPLDTPSKSDHIFPPHYGTAFAQNLIPLSRVSRFYRTECLDHLDANTSFDFGSDGEAFQIFCCTAPAELLVSIRHVSITLVEGYITQMPRLPNLCTLVIDLWPREPTRKDPRDHRAWGPQTEVLLADLGTVVAVRARITLEMRWAADCERFEGAYVEKGRWRRVMADDEKAAQTQGGGFCRRRYELCANGEPTVDVAETEKEFSIFGKGSCYSILPR